MVAGALATAVFGAPAPAGDDVPLVAQAPKAGSFLRLADRRVIPGRSVGPFRLGRPIPADARARLGPPTAYAAPGTTPDSGSCAWDFAGEGRLLIKLHDGVRRDAIHSIYVGSRHFATAEGLRVGDAFARVKALAPAGRKDIEVMDADFAWVVAGASYTIVAGKVVEILIH
jgi:hypothetical protein